MKNKTVAYAVLAFAIFGLGYFLGAIILGVDNAWIFLMINAITIILSVYFLKNQK